MKKDGPQDPVRDFVLADAAAEEQQLAQTASDGLIEIFSTYPADCGRDDLVAIFHRNASSIKAAFASRGKAGRFAIHYKMYLLCYHTLNNAFADPRVLLGNMSLVNTLQPALLPGLLPSLASEIREILLKALDGLLARFMPSVSSQVHQLCASTLRVVEVLNRMAITKSTVHIVEFPVGNSIPCKLAADVLRQRGITVALDRIALSRNDKQTAGLTRKDLIQRRLDAVMKDDIVLYVDEWLTGANFRNLSEMLFKTCRQKEAYLLPVGLLGQTSRDEERFTSYTQHHDTLAAAMGMSGSDLRFVFPPLASQVGGPTYFFWSEFDRLAGYRKIQFWGALLSSLDEAIMAIAQDDKLLQRAKMLFVRAAARSSDRQIPPEVLADTDTTRELANASMADYMRIRSQLLAIASPTPEGVIEGSTHQAFEELGRHVDEVVGSQPAKLIILFAIMLIRDSLSLDPADRYFFKQHVPTVSDLDSEGMALHDGFMRRLKLEARQIGLMGDSAEVQ